MTELDDKITYLAEIKISRPGTKQEYLALVAQTESEIAALIALLPPPEPDTTPTFSDRLDAIECALSDVSEIALDLALGL